MNKLTLIVLAILILSPFLVESTPSYVFEKDEAIDLKASCFNDNDQICGDGTDCYLTVFRPDSSILLDNVTMSNNGAYYNYTVNTTQNSNNGEHSAVIYCSGDSDSYGTFTYDITPNGGNPTEADSILYIGLFIVLIILLTLTVLGAFNTENEILKWGLIDLGYIFLVAVTFITWNIASNFLTAAPFLISMMYILFRVLMAVALPFVAGSMIYLGYRMITIKEIQGLMDKGIPEDEARARRGKKW